MYCATATFTAGTTAGGLWAFKGASIGLVVLAAIALLVLGLIIERTIGVRDEYTRAEMP